MGNICRSETSGGWSGMFKTKVDPKLDACPCCSISWEFGCTTQVIGGEATVFCGGCSCVFWYDMADLREE